MDARFDSGTLLLIALIALLIGYVIGALRSTAHAAAAAPVRPLQAPEDQNEIRALLAQGKRLVAIRRLREQTGASLEDALRAVEGLERQTAAERLGLLREPSKLGERQPPASER